MITRAQLTPKLCIDSLSSAICPACGRGKKRRMTLCRSDFYKLPWTLRRTLYARIGHGYEEALLEALNFLQVQQLYLPEESP